jgi:hypothetical protein
MRTGSEPAPASDWYAVFTYYDFCYVMRAVTLAARYEAAYFRNEPQANEYLTWAQQLASRVKVNPTPRLTNDKDVSNYYFLLAHSSLAREFSFLENALGRDIQPGKGTDK